nr:hypothetical protein [Tanacetum cinerariifolium]
PLDPYVQLVMEAPHSPDYIPGPEAPPSPGYIPGSEAPPLPNYIPGPEYPEHPLLADDVVPAEEQPLPATLLPIAESPGYITESEPEMEPEEDDGDNENSVSASEEIEPFEEGETAATPPPFGYRVAARISVQPHILMLFCSESEVDRLLAIPTPPLSPVSPTSYPLPPFLMPLPIFTPLPTSSFLLPLSLPSTSGSESIPEADIPLRKRAHFTTPTGGYEKMAPKRTTRSTQVPQVTPAPTATTTTVTEAQLQALINQGVAAAMAEVEASRVRNGYSSNGSGPRLA